MASVLTGGPPPHIVRCLEAINELPYSPTIKLQVLEMFDRYPPPSRNVSSWRPVKNLRAQMAKFKNCVYTSATLDQPYSLDVIRFILVSTSVPVLEFWGQSFYYWVDTSWPSFKALLNACEDLPRYQNKKKVSLRLSLLYEKLLHQPTEPQDPPEPVIASHALSKPDSGTSQEKQSRVKEEHKENDTSNPKPTAAASGVHSTADPLPAVQPPVVQPPVVQSPVVQPPVATTPTGNLPAAVAPDDSVGNPNASPAQDNVIVKIEDSTEDEISLPVELRFLHDRLDRVEGSIDLIRRDNEAFFREIVSVLNRRLSRPRSPSPMPFPPRNPPNAPNPPNQAVTGDTAVFYPHVQVVTYSGYENNSHHGYRKRQRQTREDSAEAGPSGTHYDTRN